MILDLGLPDLDGVEVIQGLRGWTDAPIIVLSGRADSSDKVEALDAGADDYVTKPFSMDELLARMRAVTRRQGRRGRRPAVRIGDLTVDLAAKRVIRADGADVRLTPTEWHLLDGAGAVTRASCSASSSCSPRSGVPATRTRPATCASTWPSCGASSSPTRPGRASCSPSPAWGTGSSRAGSQPAQAAGPGGRPGLTQWPGIWPGHWPVHDAGRH